MSLIRRAPKRFSAAVLVIAAAVIIPAAALAWGPDRPTFTGKDPAPYVTFNSITDNPQVGDERNFVRIRESGTTAYGDNVSLTPGKVYDVSVYYHNNAKTSLNESGAGIARDAKLKMEVPGVVEAGVNAAFTGKISASNSNPGTVWDEAYGKNSTNGQVALRYVSNSAKFVSKGAINGQTLPDTLFTTGAKLGFNSQNGEVPGCNEFSGYVNFQIRVDQPNFEVVKKVSVDGGATWADSAKAKPGASVKYAISYQNTGTNQQDNVLVRDILPQGVTYDNSTKAQNGVADRGTFIKNSTTQGVYKKTIDGITTNGLNAGSYQPKGNVSYQLDAKLPSEDALKCGTNTLTNTARVTTNSGYKEDTATVTIDKECKPPVVKYVCDALKVDQIDRTNFKFTTAYSVQNATFKSVTYVIKNAAGTVVDTKTSTGTTLNYAQTTAGTYTVQATVTFTVNGADKTATSDACKGSFKVKELPKEIVVCELATKKIVTIKESDFDASKYSKNLNDCKEEGKITVCELATKKIVTIKESQFDSSKYSKNLDDCKTPEDISVCELATKTIVKISPAQFDETKYSKDLSKCEETPVTPPELPHTGIGENIVAIFGLGALIASAAYYIASRRALNQ